MKSRPKHIGNTFHGNARTVIQAGHITVVTSPKRSVLWTALLIVLSYAGGSAGNASSAASTPPPRANAALVAAGQLTSCTDRPAAMGIDVDLIDLVAKRLGVTTRVVNATTEELEDGSALNAGRCDITTGLLIFGSRQVAMDFSVAYFFDRLGLLVKKDAKLTKLNQLTRAGTTLGVQRGSRAETQARQRNLAPIPFDDEDTLFQALLSGQLDAVLHDLVAVNRWLRITAVASTFDRTDEIDLDIFYGLAVKKSNTELLDVVNDTLRIAARDGTWTTLYKKHVLSDPSAIPIR